MNFLKVLKVPFAATGLLENQLNCDLGCMKKKNSLIMKY